MPLKRIVMIDTGRLSPGSFVDLTYAAEVNLTIKKILVVEATGSSINSVFTTLYIGDVPYLTPNVSLAIFSPSNPTNPDINLVLPAGVKLSMRVTNGEIDVRRLFIHLVCE